MHTTWTIRAMNSSICYVQHKLMGFTDLMSCEFPEELPFSTYLVLVRPGGRLSLCRLEESPTIQ